MRRLLPRQASEARGIDQARHVVDVDPAASSIDHPHGVTGGEHADEEVPQARGAEAAVGARLAEGFSQPPGAVAPQVHEPDPHAVAFRRRHRGADGAELYLVEAEAT